MTLLIGALVGQLVLGQFTLISLAQRPASGPEPPPKSPQSESQQKARSDEDETVRITTNLVQVDAVITDKNGKPVKDLRADEVQIFEDGQEQKVTHFSLVNAESQLVTSPEPATTLNRNAPPAPPVKLQPKDIRRTIALVVDDLGLSFESTYDVRRALKKFVDQQMQPGDLVAILRTSGGMGALQQFTADKRQLYAAIERVKWYVNGRAGVGAFPPIESTPGNSEDVLPGGDDNQGNTERLRPPSKGNSGMETQAASRAANQSREDIFAVGTLGALRYVVTGMRELPGRKSILMISDGFSIFRRNDPSLNYRVLSALRRLVDTANRATVVIYTMNATGLQTLSLTAEDSVGGMNLNQVNQRLDNRRAAAFEMQEVMDYLARETGGIAIRNSNDLSGGIRRVIEDQKSYYLIGYRPDESTFDAKTGSRTFHKLSLKILRPGKYNVRMRNGFYGVVDDEHRASAATPSQRIIAALISPFGAAGLRLRLTTLFADDAKFGSYMRSLLHINANDLTFSDLPNGEHQADFDVVAVTFGDNGNIIDQVNQSYTMRIGGDDYERIRRDGFVYFLTVPIKKAGAYQLRVALRDRGSELIGSASQFIEVPDIRKNRLLISGILVTAMDPITGKPGSAQPNADNVKKSIGNQDVKLNEWTNTTNSAAARQFRTGQILQYSFVMYNARLAKENSQPQSTTQIRLFRDGQVVFMGKEKRVKAANQADLNRLTVEGALQLGREIIPGEYILHVTATDALANEKHRVTSQWIDFEVL